jgi:hypothetical protein
VPRAIEKGKKTARSAPREARPAVAPSVAPTTCKALPSVERPRLESLTDKDRKSFRKRVRGQFNTSVDMGDLKADRLNNQSQFKVNGVVEAFSQQNNVAYVDCWDSFDCYSETM